MDKYAHIKKSRPTQFCQASLLLFWPFGMGQSGKRPAPSPRVKWGTSVISIKWAFNGAWKHVIYKFERQKNKQRFNFLKVKLH